MFSIVIRIFNICFSLLIFGIIVGLLIFYKYTENLPSYDQIIHYQPDSTVNIYANDGEYLASIFKENRIVLSNEYIPLLLKQAIIAAEDKDFYSNPGIDFGGILRAVFANAYNYVSGDHQLAGGSTITQQIIKNIMLTKEKTLKRKIQEARLALGLNKYLTKEEILERYINHIYLGNNSYGFAQASLNYFSKAVDELTIEEVALLAALPQAPSRMDPTRTDPENHLLNRRNWIVGQMEKQNFITKIEAENAVRQPIKITKKQHITQIPLGIEYVVDEVKRRLVSLCGNIEDDIYQHGFTVYSTIHPEMQKTLTFALRKGLLEYEKKRYSWKGPFDHFKSKEEYLKFLKTADKSEVYPLKLAFVTGKDNNKIQVLLTEKIPEFSIIESNPKIYKSVKIGDVLTIFESNFDDNTVNAKDTKIQILEKKKFQIYQVPRVNGAMVVMDVKNGNVVAMSGGFNYYKNQFNRATQALRQPGSVFKPLVYLTGLEDGFMPSSILMDQPISVSQGEGMSNWQPKNYSGDYMGAITMQSSLEKSRNLSTLFLAQEVGIDKIFENGKKFGLIPKNNNNKNYSTVFGSQEVTLVDMVRFYAIIANGGFDIKTNFIDYVQNNKGQTLWRNNNLTCECAINEETEEIDHLNPIPPIVSGHQERLIDAKIDYQLLTMMEGVVRRGTAWSLAYLGENLAGKTGTSNDSKDVWFIGMSKNYAFGVYVGFDKPKSLGARATGASTAIPLMKIFLNNSKQFLDQSAFYSEDEIESFNISERDAPSSRHNNDNYSYNARKTLDDYEIQYLDPNWVGD